MRSTTILLAVMGLVAVGVGCGSDESESVSKATFIKRATAVCLKPRINTLQRVASYSEKHKSDGLSNAELGRRAIRVVVLSTIATEIEALRKLETPSGDAQKVEGIIAAQEKALDEAKARTHKSYDDIEDYFGDANKALANYGLAECSKGSGD